MKESLRSLLCSCGGGEGQHSKHPPPPPPQAPLPQKPAHNTPDPSSSSSSPQPFSQPLPLMEPLPPLEIMQHQQSTSLYSSNPAPTSDLTAAPAVPSASLGPRSWSSSGASSPAAPAETTVRIKKGNEQLGLTVESVELGSGLSGCVVKSLMSSGAVAKDGRITVGDVLVAVNNENLRRTTSTQARAILRRASLLGIDISLSYISLAELAALTAGRDSVGASTPPSQLSPNSNLRSPPSGSSQNHSASSSTSAPSDGLAPLVPSAAASATEQSNGCSVDGEESSPMVTGQTTIASASASSSAAAAAAGPPPPLTSSWGPAREVYIHRQAGESLGISIVGGRVDLFNGPSSTPPTTICGIFIKHVLVGSPAGRDGTLSKGDRILEVDATDLRDNATHDAAVAAIKSSHSPVRFVLQSLHDPDWTSPEPVVASTIPSPLPVRSAMDSLMREALVSPKKEAKVHTQPTNVLSTTTTTTPSTTSSPASPPPPPHTPTTTPTTAAAIVTAEVLKQPLPPKNHESDSEDEDEEDEVARHVFDEDEEEDQYGNTWKKIVDKYGDLGGQLHLVEFMRSGTNGLGMSLAGNRDLSTMSVFVVGIQPDSPTARDGRLKVGDQLLEINGLTIYGRSHLNASAIIKSITSDDIKIILLRRDDCMEKMAVKPLRLKAVPFKDDPNTLICKRPRHEQLESVDSQEATEVSSNNHVTVNHQSVNSTTPSDLTAKYPRAKTITLSKGNQGLGFAIQEGNSAGEEAGIYVKSVTPGGVAATHGELSTGDRLLQVQQHSLHDVSYAKAIELIRSCPRGDVQLTFGPAQQSANQAPQAAAKMQQASIVSNGKMETSPPLPPPPATEAPVSAAPTTDPTAPTTTSTDLAPQTDAPEPPVPEPPAAPEPPATAQILPGKETIIEIQKGKSGLGLSIVGGADTLLGAIIIHEVYEDGAAARDGRLWAGDQVLQVCTNDLRDATHDRAIQVLRQTPSVVQMVVFRDESLLKDEDIYDVFSVDLMKKHGKGLGISIVGRRNDTGVFISDVVKGGAAEADGRLMQGDQILAVNGEDLKTATQEHAAAVLKTLMGRVSLKIGRLKAGSRSSSRRNSNQSGSERGLKKSESNLSGKNKGKHTKSE